MKRWELSRRTLLRGVGASLALPLLEQMLPSVQRAYAAGEPRPRRMMVFFVPCGMYMPAFIPTTTGPSYTLSKTLAPLGPVNLPPPETMARSSVGSRTRAPAETMLVTSQP